MTTTATMTAITCRGYGAPDEVLAAASVPIPAPADNQVLVRVRSASVNPADWHLIRGEPRIARLQLGLRPGFTVPGCDLAGTVEEVGSGVTSLQPGDNVFGTTFLAGCGAFAEWAVAPAARLVALPAGVSHEQGAALPIAGLTALQALRDEARVAAGQRVLVVGGAGGVGTFAVQIARHLGAHVTASCSTRNLDLVSSLGADEVIDRTTQDPLTATDPYDVILQVTGEASVLHCRRALVAKGTLVQISGDSPGRWIGPIRRVVAGKVVSPFVGQRIRLVSTTPDGDDLKLLAGLVADGTVTPVIDRTHPLAEVVDALAHLEAGRASGKVLIGT